MQFLQRLVVWPQRREVTVEVLKPDEVPAAAMAEAPIYRGGEQLQPWQRSFVTLFLEHRETYGKARLLLADEVGVGKTLSMATSALVSSLLDDGACLNSVAVYIKQCNGKRS